jgi:tripartite-type tricarboxylate transporter receptor subunit TctC
MSRGFALRWPVFLIACALVLPGTAAAQSYPAKPIRIIVPFVAGGALDTLVRLLGAKLTDSFGQPIVVENRAGAGGNAGADAVAKSAPDGYTLLFTTNGLAISPALYRKLPFDAVRDFAPVSQLNVSQLLLVANPKLPAANVRELIALAKAKPGSLNYGMTGIGNPLHLTMEMFKHAAGIEMQAIPYRGDAPLNTALIAGDVHVAVVPLPTARQHVDAGAMRALAVTGAKRSAALPNVPTVAESGLPGFDSTAWHGLFAPANTPRDILATIQREAAKAWKSPEVLERLKNFGVEPVASTPEEFEAKFKADIVLFAKIVRDARIPAQD